MRRSIQPLSLPAGWTGQACTGDFCTQDPSDAAEATPIPSRFTLDELQEAAERIISDPSTLEGYSVLKYSKHGEVFRARICRNREPASLLASVVADDDNSPARRPELLGIQKAKIGSPAELRVESACGSVEIVGKRNCAVGWRRRLRVMVRSSRARRNFDQALQLLAAGILTARPLLLLERRRPRRESWIVSAFVPNLVDLDQVVLVELPKLDRRVAYGAKVRMTGSVVELLIGLQNAGLGHRDFKASNVMLSDYHSAGRDAQAWMIDLDGLYAIRSGSESRRWQPVVRLAASLLEYSMVTRTDYARFLRALLKRHPAGRDWKSRYRDLAIQATDYVRRAKRRKKDKLDGYCGG